MVEGMGMGMGGGYGGGYAMTYGRILGLWGGEGGDVLEEVEM